jgi:hypothetical protein
VADQTFSHFSLLYLFKHTRIKFNTVCTCKTWIVSAICFQFTSRLVGNSRRVFVSSVAREVFICFYISFNYNRYICTCNKYNQDEKLSTLNGIWLKKLLIQTRRNSKIISHAHTFTFWVPFNSSPCCWTFKITSVPICSCVKSTHKRWKQYT